MLTTPRCHGNVLQDDISIKTVPVWLHHTEVVNKIDINLDDPDTTKAATLKDIDRASVAVC